MEDISKNIMQFMKKVKKDESATECAERDMSAIDKNRKYNFVVCISGAANPLTSHIVSGLLGLEQFAPPEKTITRIYLYDAGVDTLNAKEYLERECCYISTKYPHKAVKHVQKLGIALTYSNLLIILDHVPWNDEFAIGDWLHENKIVMLTLADIINASAAPNMKILLPNLGPSCYNASILIKSLKSVKDNNIVVATSDLGLEIVSQIAEIAKVPAKNIYCPPVWGFVGINHLVDARTTIHRYNTFFPYERYKKVHNSTLIIGHLTPEMRPLEYLMHNDDTLWLKIAERKEKAKNKSISFNKAISVINVAKFWLFGAEPNRIVNLGILCNGAFGLTFDGIFSQPARFENGFWQPAHDFMLPKDQQVKLPYLQFIAEMSLQMEKAALPNIIQYMPIFRRPRFYKTKKRDIRFTSETLAPSPSVDTHLQLSTGRSKSTGSVLKHPTA